MLPQRFPTAETTGASPRRHRVLVGVADIRRSSPTFGRSVQFEWAERDGVAIVIPRGVAHVVLFQEDSVLAFGLSDYWHSEIDVVGCQWDAPELGFEWPTRAVRRSDRDTAAGSYREMLDDYERLSESRVATRPVRLSPVE